MFTQRARMCTLHVSISVLAAALLLTLTACGEDAGQGGGLSADPIGPTAGSGALAGAGGAAPAAGAGIDAGAGGQGGMVEMAGSGGVAGQYEAGSGGVAGQYEAGSGVAGQDVAGTGGDAGGSPPPAADPFLPDRCNGDASKTIMIGDSYLALSGDITRFLQQWSGQTYRTYYASATQLEGGFPPTIPDQYRQLALPQGPVQTIIMTGGGNDVLIGDPSCRTTPATTAGSQCESTVLRVVELAKDLLEEAAGDGVEEVIYFFYPHVAGMNVSLNPTLDYAYPLARDLCESATGLHCTFVDTRAAFEGHPEYIILDGIHPSTSGSEAIAQLVWEVMEDNCTNGITIPPER